MNPDRYGLVKEILLRVLDLPEGERQLALDHACGEDRALRAEVEALLEHDDLPLAHGHTSSDDAGSTVVTPPPARFTPGQILGSRYRIARLLGRGGMGEVWQAYDLKLQVDVALKLIRTERFEGQQGLELLRREVRTAREVISPNVCRIFDLVEAEGQEFVSMEYIDGETLLDMLMDRGPLDLQEATRIASQFLSGLEAIHQAGFVHRDVKPENIMVTRTGRVVLMDFGIAKGIAEDGQGTIAGTPAYMAPEQSMGVSLDARADIFAAGVVLAEMGAPEGIKEPTSRKSIWQAVRQTPVRLSDGPWRRVLERAVASEPSGRYESARELARALEEVTLRVEGAEDKRPYPGLESFTEADADFFFGREAEVEAVWKKLARANLLAIIGPSGAGKTSFVRAGLLPAKPAGWRHIIFRPGSSPFVALARALAPELAAGAAPGVALLGQLLQIEDPTQALAVVTRWGRLHDRALIVLDQFEELFTLCAPEAQARFADLLGRMTDEADVHVLLVMRDDFLFRCHDHPRLASVTADLTLLGPPTGGALRRALVQPALLCGYRFEDESLADKMIAAVEGERGALPMLAFAAARLWENRDREKGLLTREVYERIGGVSGALAQHAELTLERIGVARLQIVREIFRNLVTAQGTRAGAEVDELLSVFPERDAAGAVLRELIDARLLTSFELPAAREGGPEQHRVEIVHESLLTHWPRLVRWQTQDTEGAQLRDQLRQAAQLWKERHESEDLLWTGTAYQEFGLWRQRYAGRLTETEERFATAMAERAERSRRRRRRILVSSFATLFLVASAMTTFGLRAEIAQRRSEASRLLLLGRNKLEEDPTAALAYAIKSVETADSPDGRRFAMEVLARGPAARNYGTPPLFRTFFVSFSPDGRQMAVGGARGVRILSEDGSTVVVEEDQIGLPSSGQPQFSPDGHHVVFTAGAARAEVRVWSLSQRREVRRFSLEGTTSHQVRGHQLFLVSDATGQAEGPGSFAANSSGADETEASLWSEAVVRRWSFDEKDLEPVGRWDLTGVTSFDIDRSGQWVAYTKGREVLVRPVTGDERTPARFIGRHRSTACRVLFDAEGQRLVSGDSLGEVCLWSLADPSGDALRTMNAGGRVRTLCIAPSGKLLVAGTERDARFWNLNGPLEAEAVVLHRSQTFSSIAIDPAGSCVAAASRDGGVSFWQTSLSGPYIFHMVEGGHNVAFTPDGRTLVGADSDGSVRAWSLAGEPTRVLRKPTGGGMSWMAMDPLGRFVALAAGGAGTWLVPIAAGPVREIPVESDSMNAVTLAFSPDGQRLAVAGDQARGIRLHDLATGSHRILESSGGSVYWDLKFSGVDRLFSSTTKGEIEEWNLRGGDHRSIGKTERPLIWMIAPTRDSRYLAVCAQSNSDFRGDATAELRLYDLEEGSYRSIRTHGNRVTSVTFDRSDKVLVTADADGLVRVGPVSGDEPHILVGGREWVAIDVDPNGRWIVASGGDTAVLWPMPTGRPFHTLPRQEFLDSLRVLTNLRVRSDRDAPAGYRLDPEAFRGWRTPTVHHH